MQCFDKFIVCQALILCVSKTAKHIAVASFQLSHAVTELGLVTKRPDALRERCTGEIIGGPRTLRYPRKFRI